MLLNLAILCTVMALFPLIIQNIGLYKAVSTDNYDINLELCLRDIIAETSDKELSVKDGKLLAHDKVQNKIYSYLTANQRLIRKVDQQGYTILLEEVRKATFLKKEGHIFLELEWQGRRYQRHETFQIR